MGEKPRVLFMGTPAFAVPSLLALTEQPAQWEVVAVVTQPDKPAGRGRKLSPSEVKVAAQTKGIPVLEPTRLKAPETLAALGEFRPDIAVVVAYGRILPPALLELPRLGCINVHASLLPRHRGASPIAHAILANDEETGITIMQLDEGLDTGPTFTRASLPIPPDATCGSLTEALAELGANLLVQSLPGILQRTLVPIAQNDAQATYAPILEKQDGHLDFTGEASALERQIRAFDPWPGAFTHLSTPEPLRVQVLKAEAVGTSVPGGAPGEVLDTSGGGVLVACGQGALRLLEVKPAGRKQMTAASWIAGRGVEVGQHFSALPPITA